MRPAGRLFGSFALNRATSLTNDFVLRGRVFFIRLAPLPTTYNHSFPPSRFFDNNILNVFQLSGVNSKFKEVIQKPFKFLFNKYKRGKKVEFREARSQKDHKKVRPQVRLYNKSMNFCLSPYFQSG